jgi:integrase
MKLSDQLITKLKTTGKGYKRADGGGLYIQVTPVGGKSWRMFYRFQKKPRTICFGLYPELSVKDARAARDEIKSLLAQGIDPAQVKKAGKQGTGLVRSDSFEGVAREWLEKKKNRPDKRGGWSKKYSQLCVRRLETHIFPYLGKRPISQLKPLDILRPLQTLEDRGISIQAHKVMQICGQVFRYAVATGRAERNVILDIQGALTPAQIGHFPTIVEPEAIGRLLQAIDAYPGSFILHTALRLSPLLFVRPSELRCAEWTEFHLDQAEWRIAATRMKMGRVHIVPLARQSLELIHRLRETTGDGKYLFPSYHRDKPAQPMGHTAINYALRSIGYPTGSMTGHGFRAMASTCLNEQNIWNPDAIERQLAHSEGNNVRAVYNYAEFLPERRIMMQVWADYLDGLRQGKILRPGELLDAKQIEELRNQQFRFLPSLSVSTHADDACPSSCAGEK